MRDRWWGAAGFAALAFVVAACGSSSGPSTAAPSSTPSRAAAPSGASAKALMTTKISGVTVLTNSKGLTLYWFARDTSTKSNCSGTCAHYWPPVPGPATAGAGVTGSLGTVTRSDGSLQATYDRHPLYTYVGDTAPGQAKGNGLNLDGGVWHEVTVSGASAPSPSSSGGYGY